MWLETHEVCSVPDRSRYRILSVVRVECGFDGGPDPESGSVEYLIPALRRAAVMCSPLRDRQRSSRFAPFLYGAVRTFSLHGNYCEI